MSVLIINRDKDVKYTEILSELKDELVVLSWYPLPDSDQFMYFEIIPDMRDLTYYLELKAIELNNFYNFKTIIAEDEFDLLRAAKLRDYLNIEGQTEHSAIAFRDKVIMKDYLKGKVAIPEYKSLSSAGVLNDFVKENGYPFVIKPRDKAGAQGVSIIKDKEDLIMFSKQKWEYDLEVEKFISGDMYHIDAFVNNDNISMFMVSKYVNGCFSFFEENSTLGSHQLHPDDQISLRLKDYFVNVLNSLPTPKISAYHMEVFHTKDDKIIFCEIGSRIGGGHILDAFKNMYSIDLLSHLYRSWCGLPVNEPKYDKEKLTGWLMIPPKKGKLLSIPETIDFDWVDSYNKQGEVNKIYEGPSFFADRIASIVISGSNSKELLNRTLYIEKWYNKNVRWEIAPK